MATGKEAYNCPAIHGIMRYPNRTGVETYDDKKAGYL